MCDPEPKVWHPEDLWRGYDPRALPLDVHEIKVWNENGCSYRELTFTSEVADGKPVRVFAIEGAPASGRNLPGILHIHGGGQTASLDWVRFWAKRRYVCVSFDYCGPWADRTEYTDWGPLTHCNMAHAEGGYQVHPTPRASAWYHWALASRRAITLLEGHPAVNTARIGVFGISMGGTLTWLVAGSDRRVKAAVPIYGCGYNVDPRKTARGLPEPSEDQMVYKAALSPEAHAPMISCPVLFLDATNDHHGWMDDAYDALAAVRGPSRQAFTPRYIHHIEPEQGRDLPLWMDWHLRGGNPWPKTPIVRAGIDPDGELSATVTPDRAAGVTRVDVYYCLGDRIPPDRLWRQVVPSREGSRYTAPLPVMDVRSSVHMFANVEYTDGVCLTSNLVKAVPGRIGNARKQLAWSPEIAGSEVLSDWRYSLAYTDPNVDSEVIRILEEGRRRFVTVDTSVFGDPVDFVISSHAIGDPQWHGRDGMSLQFRCRGGFDEHGLTVSLVGSEWTLAATTYTAIVPQSEIMGGWRIVDLPMSAFRTDQGKRLTNWELVEKLELKGRASRANPPCFGEFRWAADHR
jgi:dienelactone hydrolase